MRQNQMKFMKREVGNHSSDHLDQTLTQNLLWKKKKLRVATVKGEIGKEKGGDLKTKKRDDSNTRGNASNPRGNADRLEILVRRGKVRMERTEKKREKRGKKGVRFAKFDS